MTFGEIIEKSGSHAVAELGRSLETVDAVFDDQLWTILRHYKLLEPLDRGELRCYLSKVPLTRDNVGGLIGTPNGPQLIADNVQVAVDEP